LFVVIYRIMVYHVQGEGRVREQRGG